MKDALREAHAFAMRVAVIVVLILLAGVALFH